jgi:16S rRNA processing protein RimM
MLSVTPSVPSDPAASDDRVLLGAIVGPRGLKGEVRVNSFTQDPAAIAAYGPLEDEGATRTFELTVVSVVKGQVIARIRGIDDRAGVEALKGTGLYVAREALPAPETDEYYAGDLVGLRAELATGDALGTVTAAHDFGAGPILEIATGDHGGVMVPFTRGAVPAVGPDAGRVVVVPPAGLLEPAQGDQDGGEE